jgi:F-type H+-transporting ATPase subunit delta
MSTNQSDPVARIYAAALYETAHERGIVGEVDKGLEVLRAAWQDKTFRNFFTSPRVPRATKLAAMTEALSDRVCTELLNFIKVLIVKGREPQFNNIVDAFDVYRDVAEDRVHAWVEAGSPFGDEDLESLKRKLSESTGGKEVVMHYRHNEELIGGAKIRMGDRMIDNTLRSRLARLTQELAKI